MQIVAITVSFALTVAAVALLVPAVRKMLGVIRTGQPAPGRSDNPGGRAVTMLKETFLHTRMLQWHWVGIMHWFVYMAFLFLSTAVLAAYFQLFKPDFAWPVIGHWYPYEWFSEVIGLLSTVGIVFLIVYRQKHHPRNEGRRSRFFGSTMWQAYFVEALALLEGSAILFVRAAEWKLDEEAGRSHYPISSWIGDAIYPTSVVSLENLIYFIAMFKIALAMVWLMVIARNITMGIAWHRFTAWFNIFYKRESDGSTALGAMKPLTSAGVPVTLDDIEELDEDSTLGVGKIEDFSWKGMLDFTTCTECGRCQSQCPAWNTEKPLSPKLLVLGLRDHAYAKAPYVQAGGEDSATATALLEKDEVLAREAARPLVGDTGDEWFYMPEDGSAVIDSDVLWNCTSCGACVQQCPVDIEHVDHIMDMRRYQVLVEANFPAELNQLFKGLENKGNPWNMSASARMDWAKGLDFDVPVVGEDLESLESVDWLFWVGCAGAYEDRAKKTTRAVAELLDMAGISFGVLGNGETCTGDPARRAGNEFVFQGLAAQNVETFKEYKVKKVVSTCAHCFNTLKNEYKDFGIELEVVHHTQLLNRLVREGKLTPIKDGAGAAKRSITYHDPCYLGRHNQVYSPPRELLQILPGAEFTEMERNSEKSFCCGAGGARMWMEENIGERINVNRTQEAVGTGADQIAVGCPFCRVMLSDGLTAEQAKGNAREEVEILDVAQMLLASVKGEAATKAGPGTSSSGSGGTTPAPASAAGSGAGADTDVATKAEPEPGDVTATEDTVTETADAGPAAKASGGSSLFDVEEPATAPEKSVAETPADATHAPAAPSQGSGSLFDLDEPAKESAPSAPTASTASSTATGSGSLFDLDAPAAEAPAKKDPAPATEEPAAKAAPAKPAADLGSGGSLFDLTPEEPAAKAEPAPAPEPAAEAPSTEPAAAPAADLGSGSLFDIAAEPAPSATTAPAEPAPAAAAEPATAASSQASTPATSIPEGGSLFDIEAPTPTAARAAPAAPAASDEAATPATGSSDVPSDEPTTSDEPAAPATESQDVPGGVPSDSAAAAEAPSEVPAASDVAAASGQASTPATSIPEGGSLFDIEAPTPTAAPAAPATADATTSDEPAAPATDASDVPSDEPTTSDEAAAPATGSSDVPEQAEGLAGGAALSQAATFAAADEAPAEAAGATPEAEAPAELPADTGASEPSDEAPAEAPAEASDVTEPEQAPEEPVGQQEQPKPASNGAAHTPRTDVDINESGSLFDL